MNFGVTGTGGYLGSRVLDYLTKLGHTVHSFSRRDDPGDLHHPYSLEKSISKDILSKLDVLIHCAYDFTLVRWDDIVRVNVEGTKRLFDDAHDSGVQRLVFISTMSSFEGCKSRYGAAKFTVEQYLSRYAPVIIKPGLIHGRNAKGMVGALRNVILSLPIVPVVGGSRILYLIHEKDLCELIYRASSMEQNGTVEIVAANQKGKSYREILQLLAHGLNKKRIFIPIPYHFVYGLLAGSEKLGMHLGFRSDSLVSLYNQNERPDFSSLEGMKCSPSEFTGEEEG